MIMHLIIESSSKIYLWIWHASYHDIFVFAGSAMVTTGCISVGALVAVIVVFVILTLILLIVIVVITFFLYKAHK